MSGFKSVEAFMTDAMIQALEEEKENMQEENENGLELKRVCESEDVKYLRA